MTIKLFHIENYIIDTSKFDHALHDPCVNKLEKEFAEYVGAKYACSINSATNAIFLILLGKNTTINVPSIIPPVVLNAIINSGNKINFVDNVDWVGNSYTLHNFGGYKVIDSAQKVQQNQFQTEANPQDLMFFSFYPTKPVGGLDGGMIVSDDFNKIRYFKEAVLNGMSYSENNWERKIKFPGWKMYLNSFQAEIAYSNFKKLSKKMNRLTEVRNFYNEALGLNNTSAHLYRVSVEDNKKSLLKMRERGIICGIHYDAMHTHGIYKNSSKDCPKSALVASQTLSIPFHEKLEKDELVKVIENIKEEVI